MKDLPDLITIKEAAGYLRVSPQTIYRLIQQGKFPGAFRVGSDWRIVKARLEEMMKEGTDWEHMGKGKMRVAR